MVGEWKHVSDRDREIINNLALEGVSEHRISLRVGFSVLTIRRVKKRFRESGSLSRKPGHGLPKKTTTRDYHYIC